MSAINAAFRRSKAWLVEDTPGSALHAAFQQFYRSGQVFLANKLAVIGLTIVLGLVLVACFAPLLAPYDPLAIDLSNRFAPPGSDHLMGTDELGRDILSRVIFGARLTLYIVMLVVSIIGSVGLIVGTVAGYFGGWIDAALMRIADILMAFPGLILALAFVSALGRGLDNAIIAISLTAWPQLARLVRSEALIIRDRDYVSAARIQGASHMRIICRYIVPVCLNTLVVRITLYIAGIILTAAGLGFLGLGAQPPSPEWGAMLSSGRQYMLAHWWLAAMPGLAIMLVTLGFSLLGDGLRDVLDPRND